MQCKALWWGYIAALGGRQMAIYQSQPEKERGASRTGGSSLDPRPSLMRRVGIFSSAARLTLLK